MNTIKKKKISEYAWDSEEKWQRKKGGEVGHLNGYIYAAAK